MAFSISSVAPDKILSDGGHQLVITGVFEKGFLYRVHLGDLGTTGDPACYSGKPGQANLVYPTSSDGGTTFDTLTVYSPKVTPNATPYDITVINYTTLEVHVLSGVVTALKNQFFTSVYAVRHLPPPHYKTGPRNIDLEEPV